ncbi:MAG: VacJ family lipoprotein, partial [Altererythrobacter sp.]|nr:VacJ family lipoprotein [Altererythrobacter sp.]
MAFSLASSALLFSSAPAAFMMQPQVMALAQASAQQEQVTGEQIESSPPIEGENVIVVTGEGVDPLKDPLENVNIQAYELTQDIDKALVEPIAEVYEEDLPSPIRKGLRNFLRNLMEPVNALNYLLQLKPGKALETVGRFAINTTVGVGGLFDVAKKEPFDLPYRRNGFANTLGYYGVGPGPFLVLPLVGATTLRDLLGSGIDQSILPFAVGKPFNTPYYAIPAYTVNSLEFRIEFDERIGQINDSDDPYYALRESYLCNREADIAALKNQPPPRDCSIEA